MYNVKCMYNKYLQLFLLKVRENPENGKCNIWPNKLSNSVQGILNKLRSTSKGWIQDNRDLRGFCQEFLQVCLVIIEEVEVHHVEPNEL